MISYPIILVDNFLCFLMLMRSRNSATPSPDVALIGITGQPRRSEITPESYQVRLIAHNKNLSVSCCAFNLYMGRGLFGPHYNDFTFSSYTI